MRQIPLKIWHQKEKIYLTTLFASLINLIKKDSFVPYLTAKRTEQILAHNCGFYIN